MQEKLGLFQKWQTEAENSQDKTFNNNDFVKNKKLQNYFEALVLIAFS